MRARRGIQCLALACACAGAASPARAGAGEPAAATAEPEWSVTARVLIGYGHERVAPTAPDGVAAGFSILVRRGGVAAGPLFEAAAGGNRDSGYLGLAAGPVFDLAPWARIELLAEGGVHFLSVESDYAWQPPGRAVLPYLGGRAALLVLAKVVPGPLLLWARRAGVGLQVGVRTDLSRPTVRLSYPPELGRPPDAIGVGGGSLSVLLVVPVEW